MRLNVRTLLIVLFFNCLYGQMAAQEQIGLRLGNYTGINAVHINPAWAVGSSFDWDVNIIAAGGFATTNYAFVENARLPQLWSGSDILWRPDLTSDVPIDSSALIADAFPGSNNRYAFGKTFITLPSVLFRVKGHTLGISMRMRAEGAFPKVPGTLSYYALDTLDIGDRLIVDPFKGAAMAWSEIGLTYGNSFVIDSERRIDFGVSLKYLQGYEGYYFQNTNPIDLTWSLQDTATLQSLDARLGYATNIQFNEDGSTQDYQFQRNGSGWSMDLGASYVIMDQQTGKPRLRLGVALLDVGKINFRSNAAAHQLRIDSSFLVNLNDYENIDTREELVTLASSQVFGDSSESLVADQFALWLPTAISLQADFAVHQNVYVSASWVRRLTVGEQGVQRANSLAITPRFETRALEAGVPMSWTNGRQFRMGTYVRLGPLTMGTDKLGGWLTKQNTLNGADFYVALKVNPFWNNNGGKSRSRGKSGQVKCYNF